MQPENPESYSAPAHAVWPAAAIPGRPGAHLRVTQTDRADEAETPSALEAIPDAEPTCGSKLLDELRAQIAQFVIPPSPEALDAITLWVVATHLQPAWQHAPRLAVVGPAKRCGKSADCRFRTVAAIAFRGCGGQAARRPSARRPA